MKLVGNLKEIDQYMTDMGDNHVLFSYPMIIRGSIRLNMNLSSILNKAIRVEHYRNNELLWTSPEHTKTGTVSIDINNILPNDIIKLIYKGLYYTGGSQIVINNIYFSYNI